MARPTNPQKIAFWQARIQAQAQSGLTIADFCKQQRCSMGAFYLWKRRLQELAQDGCAEATENPEKPNASLNHFVELLPKRSSNEDAACLSGGMIEIHLRSGALIRLPAGDVRLVQAIVESLRCQF